MNLGFDILSDVLGSLQVCGSLLLHESYAPPWAIAIPEAKQLGSLLGIEPGVRVVAFHLVDRGYIDFIPQKNGAPDPDCPPLVVEAGELAVCFGGVAHQISQGDHPPSVAVEKVLTTRENLFRQDLNSETRPGTGTRSASLLCGVFQMHDTHLNPLFAALPPVLHTSLAASSRLQHLGVADLLAQEVKCPSPGSHYMMARLLELLCAEVVRSHLATIQPQQTGWLTGLKDPVVGQALSLIHAQPGAPWSVDALAQAVALSSSRFAARFKATLGESPMSYVAKWRVQLASRQLDRTEKTISEIASEVGYDNLPAFNRAFKRHLQMPPGKWRSRHTT